MDTRNGVALERVEHALGLLRAHLAERATHRWSDDRVDQLAKTIAGCLRHGTAEIRLRSTLRRDCKLPRILLRSTIRFVKDNLESKLGWDEIAAAVDLDPITFGSAFRLATGMTPRRYVIRCRIRKAMWLLSSETMTLADIALAVGCSCQSHLTTMFRKHLGTTPGAFRRAARNGGLVSSCGATVMR